MHLLLLILKTIGIILLILIGIVIALLLLLLFFPFIYKARIQKNGEFRADAYVVWLFGLIKASVQFVNGALEWDVKIAGFSLKPLLTGGKKKKRPKKLKKAKKQPTIMPGEKADRQVKKDAKAAARAEIKIQQGKKQPSRDIYEEGEPKGGSLIERLKEKAADLVEKGKLVIQVGRAYSAVRKRLFKIVKHLLPRKISGFVHYGFDDPSMTGKILAAICAFYPVIPDKLTITPDFLQEVFECDLQIKGRFFLIYLVFHGLIIFFNKEVQAALKKAKN